jgi:hypothetical protein
LALWQWLISKESGMIFILEFVGFIRERMRTAVDGVGWSGWLWSWSPMCLCSVVCRSLCIVTLLVLSQGMESVSLLLGQWLILANATSTKVMWTGLKMLAHWAFLFYCQKEPLL